MYMRLYRARIPRTIRITEQIWKILTSKQKQNYIYLHIVSNYLSSLTCIKRAGVAYPPCKARNSVLSIQSLSSTRPRDRIASREPTLQICKYGHLSIPNSSYIPSYSNFSKTANSSQRRAMATQARSNCQITSRQRPVYNNRRLTDDVYIFTFLMCRKVTKSDPYCSQYLFHVDSHLCVAYFYATITKLPELWKRGQMGWKFLWINSGKPERLRISKM